MTKLRLLWIDGDKRSGEVFLLFCGCRKWITLEWIYYKNPKNSFCAAFCPKTPVQGFYYNSILGRYSYYFKFIKKSEKTHAFIFPELAKPQFGPILSYKLQNSFFESILRLYTTITSLKKKKNRKGFRPKSSIQDFSKKGYSGQLWAYMVLQFIGKNEKNCEFQFFISLEKPHFGFILIDSFWLENIKTRFLSKKILRLYVGVPVCKELGKSHTFIFQKTSFWALLAKKSKEIFLKIIWQKFRKLLPVFPEKNSWKWENVQRVSHRAFILWVQQHTALISVRKKSICVLV